MSTDWLEQGRVLAQQGHYEEALDSLTLALEHDKNNPDIHFFLGLCYSSMQQFAHAKYHYQITQALNPNHSKIRLVWDGIKEVDAQKPPERTVTPAAAAKAKQTLHSKSETIKIPKPVYPPPKAKSEKISKLKITEEKWEKAFPTDSLVPIDTTLPAWQKILLFLFGTILVVSLYYFLLNIFL